MTIRLTDYLSSIYRAVFISSLLTIFVLTLIGCNTKTPKNDAVSDSATASAIQNKRFAHVYRGETSTEAFSREEAQHSLLALQQKNPQRIVSLAPVVTETLFLLGVQEHLVGVTKFCDRPPEAQQLPKVGGYIDAQLEAVLQQKPDLVVAMPSFEQRNLLEQLRMAEIPVLIVFADRMDEIVDLVDSLGIVVNRHEQAKKTVQSIKKSLDQAHNVLQEICKDQPVLIAVSASPLVAAGQETFAHDLLTTLGAPSVFAHTTPTDTKHQKNTAWPSLSAESVRTLQTKIIVAADGASSIPALAKALGNPTDIKIVAADHTILMRPGPALPDDLATLSTLLKDTCTHP